MKSKESECREYNSKLLIIVSGLCHSVSHCYMCICCRNDMADAVIKRAFVIKQNRSLQQTVRLW